jgi:hypothetical protein
MCTIETCRRQDAGPSHSVHSSVTVELFRHTHAGRYFGGLWFKVFNERGPC